MLNTSMPLKIKTLAEDSRVWILEFMPLWRSANYPEPTASLDMRPVPRQSTYRYYHPRQVAHNLTPSTEWRVVCWT